MKKIYLILIMLSTTLTALSQTEEKVGISATENNIPDSIPSAKNSYYIKYSSSNCLFEIRINDVCVDKTWMNKHNTKTMQPINSRILKSGKQKISIILRPFSGRTVIKETNPFSLTIGYRNLTEEDMKINKSETKNSTSDLDNNPPKAPNGNEAHRSWYLIHEMPKIEVPKGGLPYYEYNAEFDADVSYEITGWSDCIDLRNIPNIENRVTEEFKRLRAMYIKEDFENLKDIFNFRNTEIMKTSYRSFDKEKLESWSAKFNEFSSHPTNEWQKIEDYNLVFSADGKLVTLESKKYNGYGSALLRLKEEGGGSLKYIYAYPIHLQLGIKEGTDKLVPIR